MFTKACFKSSNQNKQNKSYNLYKVIKLEAKTLKQIKEDKKNIFRYLLEVFAKSNKKNIFIIDEIQSLEDIYINGDKKLLNEFLNFCISLTKETHISHVLILTSNTIFLDEIYASSKMKKTSEFRLIDHLKYEDIKEWLLGKDLGFSLEDIELIYDYLGGCISDIKKLLDNYKEFNSIKEYLKREVRIAKNEIDFYIEYNKLKDEKMQKIYFIAKEIVKEGCFDNSKHKGYLDIVSKLAKAEILFFNPLENKTYANSRIYEKAFSALIAKHQV